MYLDQTSGWTNFEDIGRFHRKFGLPSVTDEGAYPRHPTHELMRFRIKFLIEELLEFAEAAGYQIVIDRNGGVGVFDQDPVAIQNPDHAEMFDGLLDLVVVAMGTAHVLGYPWQAGWNLVQQANMAKERALPDGSNSKRASGYDIVKPEGWTPPDIGELLYHVGWGIPGYPKPDVEENDPEICPLCRKYDGGHTKSCLTNLPSPEENNK